MTTLARGAGYFTRTYADDLKLAPTRLRRFGLLTLAAIVIVFPYVAAPQYVDLMNQAGIAIVGAVGLNILVGYAGQISLGQAGLLGLGGLSAAVVGNQFGQTFFVAALASIVFGAVVGLVLGLPALRLRGLYLVLATLSFHFVAIFAITDYQSHRRTTVALTGITVGHPTFGPLSITSTRQWFYFLAVITTLVVGYTLNLLRTRPGRAWIALRDRDIVAEALGIHVLRYKLFAFVVSSALVSFAGALLVYYNHSFSAETYTLNVAVIYLVMVIVGGLGNTTGAILGAIFMTIAPRLITNIFSVFGASTDAQVTYLFPLQYVVFGGLMVGFLLLEPRGLIGLWNRIRIYFELWPFRYRPLAERRR